MTIDVETQLETIPRISPKYAKNLSKMGIFTVYDLLFHLPFRYDDFSKISNISEIANGQIVTIQGTAAKIKTSKTWKKKMYITEAQVQDETGEIKVVWFNQPYISDSLTEGKNVRLSGKVSADSSGLYFGNPVWEMESRTPTNTGRLVPIYPETEGLTSRWLRWQIQSFLKLNLKIEDSIPQDILKKLHLPNLDKALKYIHFPNSKNEYLIAQKRFAFEEMFLVQIKSIQVRSNWQKEKSAKIKFDEKLIKKFVDFLPFKLTNAQKKASFQILKDLEKLQPMNRLLNGDVGSGKTIVAGISALEAMNAGYQVAIMAPTEVLALQHFCNFIKIFSEYNFKISLLTNSYQLNSESNQQSVISNSEKIKKHDYKLPITDYSKISRNNLLDKLKTGDINLVIGTHSLIQKDIRFKNLALIIVDEQHRFGVAQRAFLQQQIENINDGLKNTVPHFLTMTATPIPRTLALAFFGNLDLSVLDEMPKNRKKIITEIITPLERNKIYNFIRSEVKKGRQCFVILPLVEDSKILTEVKAAVSEHKNLSEKIFPDLKVGLVHGKLKSVEKEKVMKEFAENRLNILVATAVVEVGIDIPNATVMIIEDADRFGLSQLHQFRGRIGRGEHQSYCFLFTSSDSSSGKQRMKALAESNDGFKIAEKDLELRGPGQFFGTRQSGIPDIAMENLTNIKLIQIAREESQNLLQSDIELKKHPLLKDALQKFDEKVHLE
ncbi:MAG: ATP-dependent DNA helicase RecG [Parcubacteria group bacterium]|jgi:ATP-dependent DNA helicase RecG